MNESAYSTLSELLSALGGVEARVEGALEPLGLSMAKFNVLSELIGAEGGLSLGVLASHCACVRSNITQLVDRLESDGLVTRSYDPSDRRSVRAQLTKEGRARHASGLKALREAEAAVLARLGKRQRADLLAALELLRDEA